MVFALSDRCTQSARFSISNFMYRSGTVSHSLAILNSLLLGISDSLSLSDIDLVSTVFQMSIRYSESGSDSALSFYGLSDTLSPSASYSTSVKLSTSGQVSVPSEPEHSGIIVFSALLGHSAVYTLSAVVSQSEFFSRSCLLIESPLLNPTRQYFRWAIVVSNLAHPSARFSNSNEGSISSDVVFSWVNSISPLISASSDLSLSKQAVRSKALSSSLGSSESLGLGFSEPFGRSLICAPSAPNAESSGHGTSEALNGSASRCESGGVSPLESLRRSSVFSDSGRPSCSGSPRDSTHVQRSLSIEASLGPAISPSSLLSVSFSPAASDVRQGSIEPNSHRTADSSSHVFIPTFAAESVILHHSRDVATSSTFVRSKALINTILAPESNEFHEADSFEFTPSGWTAAESALGPWKWPVMAAALLVLLACCGICIFLISRRRNSEFSPTEAREPDTGFVQGLSEGDNEVYFGHEFSNPLNSDTGTTSSDLLLDDSEEDLLEIAGDDEAVLSDRDDFGVGSEGCESAMFEESPAVDLDSSDRGEWLASRYRFDDRE
jgi:hypothetical protein